jgi:tetratricopeptide (TPR) repeat protein
VDDRAAEALFGLGRAQLATLGHDQLDPAVTSLRRAFDHYVAVGDLSPALAIASHPFPLSFRFGYTDAGELIARALSLASPGTREAGLLLAQQGGFSGFIGADYDRAQREFRQALAIAECEGNSTIERRALANAAMVDAFHNRWNDSRARGARAIELACADGDPSTEITARRAVIFVSTATGEREHARSLLAPALTQAEQLRERWWVTSTSFNDEVLCLYEGNWSRARDAGEIGLDADPRDPRHLALRAVLEYQLGNDDLGAAYLARLQDVAEASAPPGPIADHVFLALAIPLAGRFANGDGRLDVAGKAAAGVLSMPRLNPALFVYASTALALIAVQLGDVDAAARLHATLEPQRGTASFFVPLAIDRVLGLLAATADRIDVALGHFEDGLAFCERAGYRAEYARIAVDYGDAVLVSGVADDRARAVALQDEALEIARALGMRPLVERVLARRELLEA